MTITLVDEPFVRILINSLIAQAIDRTQWVTSLNTIQIRTSAIVRPFRVDRLQHAFVHLHNLIEVLANVEVGTHRELTPLDEAVCTDIQLPSFVGHLSDIRPSQRGESRCGRNTNTTHQQVLCTLEIIVEITRNQVVEESEVSTNIIRHRTLPLESVQLQTFQIGTLSTTVAIMT